MSQRITYYLGAGASANALPLVKIFKDKRFEDFINKGMEWFDRKNEFWQEKSNLFEYGEGVYPQQSLTAAGDNFKRMAEAALEGIRTHVSPDTFAKKLYLSKRTEEYEEFKFVLDLYFAFEEIYNQKIDERWDTFYASFLDINEHNDVQLPLGLNFISWNYDRQIELSLKRFYSGLDVEFNELKLNGACNSFSNFNHDNIVTSTIPNDSDNFPRSFVDLNKSFLIKFPNRFYSSLKFAWDDEKIEMINQANNMIHNSDIIVIIGYSFPFYNRKVDSMIFNIAQSKYKSKKIYFQSADDEIIEKFEKWILPRSVNKKVNQIRSYTNFHIPFEY